MFEEEKYCKNCGVKKSPSFKYCLHCGTKFGERPIQVTENVQESVQEAVKKEEPKKEVKKPQVQKYCPKCGMEIIPEDKYCIECGHKKTNVYKPKLTEDETMGEVVEEKTSSNPIWMILLILSIINMVLLGPVTGLATLAGVITIFFDFEVGLALLLGPGLYFVISVYALKFFSKKTSKKRS